MTERYGKFEIDDMGGEEYRKPEVEVPISETYPDVDVPLGEVTPEIKEKRPNIVDIEADLEKINEEDEQPYKKPPEGPIVYH